MRFFLTLVAFYFCIFSSNALAKKLTLTEAKAAGKKAFTAKHWRKALGHFQRVLKLQRGKPLYRKAPTYLYIGSSLYHMGYKGLAWKAFEQALFQNVNLKLIGSPGAALRRFYARVQKRVRERGGQAIALRAASSGRSSSSASSGGHLTTPSPWPWALLAVSVGLVAGGVFLHLDAANNQAELSAWVKKTVDQNIAPATIEELKAPISDSISLRVVLGGSMYVVGGLGVAGAVVWLMWPKKKKTVTASSQHKTTHQMVLLPSLR